MIKEMAVRARKAFKSSAHKSYSKRQRIVMAIADQIEKNQEEITVINSQDVNRERAAGMNESLLDRLRLSKARISAIASATRKVAGLADPLGQVKISRTLENGLHLEQVTVPFGVVGMIYEARPNVTVDAAVILLMSGNSALLRGSSSARLTNEFLVDLMRTVLVAEDVNPDLIQLVPSQDRDSVHELLRARGDVDLVIPRGSAELIRTVVDEALVPTIETGAGVCHIYFDEFADAKKAIPILINAKVERPSVCNSVETLLVHKSRLDDLLPVALKELAKNNVRLHCDDKSLQVARTESIDAQIATEENFHTEYGTLDINVAVVDDLEEAVSHIERFGTKHTEAIISEDEHATGRFAASVDAAAVMINASTRFTDGEEMGFGAEIGISNQKLHARGPMGLEAMTTTTWIVTGTGQVR